MLDLHAPIRTLDVEFAPSATWFTPKWRNMKSTRRILEWHLRNSGHTMHKLALKITKGPIPRPWERHSRCSAPTSSIEILETQSTCFSPKLSFETPVPVPNWDNGRVVQQLHWPLKNKGQQHQISHVQLYYSVSSRLQSSTNATSASLLQKSPREVLRKLCP